MTSRSPYSTRHKPPIDLFYPLKQWLENLEVKNAKFAHFICRLIPCACPFERDVVVMGRTWFHIPPLCKLNPLYHQFIILRLRALTYLSDVCGEDVGHYIC